MKNDPGSEGWKRRLNIIIFGTSTRIGRNFDVVLLWLILASVAVVILESVPSIRAVHGNFLRALEWGFTIIFTVEYILRIKVSPRPLAYIFSFFGVIDFIAVIPTYLELFFEGSHYLMVIRVLRLLRVFRVMKMIQFMHSAQVMAEAMKASIPKISIFMMIMFFMAIIIGSLMYVIEGEDHGFDSIPISVYWAVVTVTTVGYGDLTPITPLGQFLATIVMLMGYSIIAVPTGIVAVELGRANKNLECPACFSKVDNGANYCINCGYKLRTTKAPEETAGS
jgi:voltage-gated potassium channel